LVNRALLDLWSSGAAAAAASAPCARFRCHAAQPQMEQSYVLLRCVPLSTAVSYGFAC
jgi:hypothetical protein